mmetsp:Transcript_9550/g.9153  ORF Transcript_9550/g.9153 Transcript_9550/m.9153 type:complete len:90 (-) Transcript_9550:49-318(-)
MNSPVPSSQEESFNGLVQKLVDLSKHKFKPISAPAIADIINALGERINKWKDLKQGVLPYLKALAYIAQYSYLELARNYKEVKFYLIMS